MAVRVFLISSSRDPLERIWNWPSSLHSVSLVAGQPGLGFLLPIQHHCNHSCWTEEWKRVLEQLTIHWMTLWKYLCYYSDREYSPLLQRTHNLDQSQRPIKSSPSSQTIRLTTNYEPYWTPLISNDGHDWKTSFAGSWIYITIIIRARG
jgi:hypothetical protein